MIKATTEKGMPRLRPGIWNGGMTVQLDGQMGLFKDEAEYDAFVEKFKRKKTTDDCYTPPLVYEAVRDWACDRFGIDPKTVVRPFWPDTDYRHFEYPESCVVLDNPPFSILSRIVEYYLCRKIRFFLFAPAMTCMSASNTMEITHIFSNAQIAYENGAIVNTAFLTNLAGDVVTMSSPSLYRAVKEAVDAQARLSSVALPKYSYPAQVLTASTLSTLARYGQEFAVSRNECAHICALDSQRKQRKGIYGGGLLLSEKAAAEKAAAEKAAAEKAAAVKWPLSPRELAIIKRMGRKTNDD